jgi:uncharacterized OsmC-like protein
MDPDTPAGAAAPAATHTHPAAFEIRLSLSDGYMFTVDPSRPGAAPFVIDEPPPLGAGKGPNPVRVLASALARCLGASLLFCLRKSRVEVQGLSVAATGIMGRNERGRLRVSGIAVELRPVLATADLDRLARCVEVFEDSCVVTQSVRPSMEVSVTVTPEVSG